MQILKPCPFCGANPYAIEVYEGSSEEDKKATAARFWNRRSEKT